MLLFVLPLFAFFKGVLMGLAIAAPVGPIAVLCIRRTLAQGRWIGLATGLGAATADGLYGMIAAFGLAALSNFLVDNTSVLQLLGGAFLCYLGLSTFFAKSAISDTSVSETSVPETSVLETSADTSLNASSRLSLAYASTFFLTLTNPATILSFIAIFAGLGITQSNSARALALVLGVFAGSALWWMILVAGVGYLRQRVTPQRLARFNRSSTKVFGVLIFAFGVVALMAIAGSR